MSMQGRAASDFSIERILSEEPVSARGDDAPGWLCCTRYRPPRLPRSSSSSSVCRARRAGRHARVPFTGAQARALEAAYSRAQYLAPPALRALAAALHLRDDRIKIWFQNRRARDRREKSSTIAPPHGITLAPTCLPPLHSTLPPRPIQAIGSYTQLDASLNTDVEINRVQFLHSAVLSNDMDTPVSHSQSNQVLRTETDNHRRNSLDPCGNILASPTQSCLEEIPSECDGSNSPLDIESVDE